MWYLTSNSDERVIYLFERKNTVTIGRRVEGANCDFTIAEDASISRKHATLTISEGALFLKDLGSKYGTYVNNSDKIESNKMTKLNSNDQVKFGKMNCIWKINFLDFITCTSTLKGENLQSLKKLLDTIGGTLKNEWDETCAFLTMPAITLTIKVVLALVQNSYIVTLDYWKKCVEAINNNLLLPNANNFTPQILESTLNKENVSFIPQKERCTLFAGKKVIFFSRRQLEMYKIILSKSSALPLLLSESKLTKSALCEEDVIVIQYQISSTSQETQSQRDLINEIIDYLKCKGKRVVADAEIGLAVLYCSISKYCNPAFNFPSEVVKQLPEQTAKHMNILAPESQNSSENLCRNGNVLIDESLTPSSQNVEIINNSKRKLSNDIDINDINNVNKKPALEKPNLPLSNKRQNDFADLGNPPKKMNIVNDDEDNMFNFMKPQTTSANEASNSNKKLSLSKPIKRKHNTDDDDDEDLFNFVDKSNKRIAVNKSPCPEVESQSTNEESITSKQGDVHKDEEKVDMKVVRGSKLEELMKNNLNIVTLKHIKKEDTSGLDEKFSNIDLGSTSVVIKADLIVKKEPTQVKAPEYGIKNFKKFKKVWPVKMHLTIVPKSSVNNNESNFCDNKENSVIS